MKKLISGIVAAATLLVSATFSTTAADETSVAGIKFKGETGYHANLYTGYLAGAEIGDTAQNIYDSLDEESAKTVKIFRRDGEEIKALELADELKSGDILCAGDTPAESNTVAVIFMGDASFDSAFSIADVTTMLKKVAGWSELSIDEAAADVDGNGAVSVSDVTLALKKIAGWDVEFVKEPVLPGSGRSSTTQKINAYGKHYTEGEFSRPIGIQNADEVGMRFSVAEGKYAKNISVKTHSLADNKGELRFSLFKWQGDYATTVAYDAIVTELFVDFTDNTELDLVIRDTAGKGIGEGEYLLLLHDGFDTNVDENGKEKPQGVGTWMANRPADDSGVTVYYQGKAMTADVSYAFGFLATVKIGDM